MRIVFSNNSKKQLRKLNVRIQQKILFILEKLKDNQKVDIIKLKNKEQEFRIRIGNYRVQLQKIDNDFLITHIGKRENFYLMLI
ncbi:type II toxin-antitoxin system mRNA interferase toxin, RelE/StbE family [Candidatus Pacearchaeota archaeon]|nr:type II toxin-antitoxin system mRNA interferase toxin, RelE/StbE family [Candidatus Pacearchaeota archaeon]|tara:strand:+ start:795 stop:1046 length:252 start_codon:yes stop_codon:yes gene_type:complete